MPSVTVELDEDQYQRLSEIAQKHGETLTLALQQIIVEPISRYHFLDFEAPQNIYSDAATVTQEEAEAARRIVASQLDNVWIEARPEALIYGMMLVATERATLLCAKAGYKYPDQYGDHLVQAILSDSTSFRKD
jgi:predicted transcriptional regulator